MEVRVSNTPAERQDTTALVVISFEKESGEGTASPAAGWQKYAGNLAEELYASGEFSGKPHEVLLLHRPENLKAKRLVLAGGGKKEKFDSAKLRLLTGTVIRSLKAKGIHDVALQLDGSLATADYVRAAVEGALVGEYETDQHKTDPKRAEKYIQSFTVLAAGEGLETAAEHGRILGEAQNLARDLGNEPPNRLTPTVLARRAQEMAAAEGLEYEVLDEARMRQMGMGSLLGVAQGSAEPPVLIVLRYKPAQAKEGVHLGLVGKAVTFDTGGISIKPSEGMEQMKYDMCGGAAVIGAMQAIARLKPGIAVTGYVPSVENMPGSKAQRPGDIVKSYSGKTVEVLNTDAEGRLILIDAITYAKEQGCTHLVDAATLTGAIVVALGRLNTGVFSNNDGFAQQLLSAAKAEGEKMWLLPTDDEYKEQLKSSFADIPNIGTRGAGSITAALFLQEFTGDTPWIHLDIAGTAWVDDAKPYLAKGPTGVGVRTFVRLAQEM